MGLFSELPEDPTDWAGLPSEPLPPRTEAELLAGADLGEWKPDLVSSEPGLLTSIEIPVPAPAPEGAAGGADAVDGDGD